MSSNKAAIFTKEAKDFLTFHHFGVLSTISVSQRGYPFGSIVPYDVDSSGRVVIYISLIAEHYKNLAADKRASLIVIDQFGLHDPQAHARATVLANFEPVPDNEHAVVQQSYEQRFPNSIKYEISHNFLFMRGQPIRIRWIGGFGDIMWIDAEKFLSTAADPLAYPALSIINHMNQDHEDVLKEFVAAFSNFNPNQFRVQMIDIKSTDFSIGLYGTGERKVVKINFEEKINNPEEARRAIIALLKKIRAG